MAGQDFTLDIQALQAALEAGAVVGGLKYLNARTPYRCSSIYRFEGNVVRNMYLYDRKGEGVPSLDAVPFGDSFCQYVISGNGFATTNSAADERLDGNPYRGVVASYVGLPLTAQHGTLYGTFCHYDFEERTLDASEHSFLQAAVPLFMPYLA
jgi:GAF domain-containing protein